jgi:hypothetical protein
MSSAPSHLSRASLHGAAILLSAVALSLSVALWNGGCAGPSVPDTGGGMACTNDDECDPGDDCVLGHCQGSSAGGDDGGGQTAGDSGPSDAGQDGGPSDAGQDGGLDGGGSDGGHADGGSDGGSPDGGLDGGGSDGGHGDGGSDGGPSDAGSADGGSDGGFAIGPTGGTVDLLDFVTTGDTRPPSCDDNAAYPSALLAQILAAMANTSPQLAVDLGDHMYVCSQSLANAQLQMGLYTKALVGFPSYFAMTMGNHECESSSCTGYSTDVNYTTFMAALGQVSKQARANYALQIQTRLGRATLVVVADESFSSTDQSWLDSALADADAHSKYTIVAKHHPVAGTRMGPTAPWQVISAHKYSLILTAHNHDYEHSGSNVLSNGRAVVCGLGGANASYTGFCRVQQAADGTLHVTRYSMNGNPGDTWSVGPQ